MKTKKTNKELLYKGIQRLVICLVLMFAGPSFLYFILSNQDKPYSTVLLVVAILICIAAIFFLFYAILTLVRAVFDGKEVTDKDLG